MSFFRNSGPEVLARFRAGDQRLLKDVYSYYADAVSLAVAATLRRHITSLRGDWTQFRAEVPDLVQEVFLRAFSSQARRRFDADRLYGPYLKRIARNLVVDVLRQQRAKSSRQRSSDFGEPFLAHQEDVFREESERLTTNYYLSQLPVELRQLHEIINLKGLSERQAAAELGVGRQVVRTLKSKLTTRLRASLGPDGAHVNEVPGARQVSQYHRYDLSQSDDTS